MHTTGIVLLLQYLYLQGPTFAPRYLSLRPRPYSAGSAEIIRRKLQRPRSLTPKMNKDELTIRPSTTSGGEGESENLSSTTPLTENRQSTKVNHSVSDQRPSLDTLPDILQEPIPASLTIGRQRPGSSGMAQSVVSPKYGSPKPDRECANLAQRPYSHSGFSNKHQTLRNKEKLPFSDMSTRPSDDETHYLLNNSPSSNRSPLINEIQPIGSGLNTKTHGRKTRDRRTTILPEPKSRVSTIGTISLAQRPSTSPSQFNGSPTQHNLHMQNRQYIAAQRPISTICESSVPNGADQNKSQPAKDQTGYRNWTSAGRDGQMDVEMSESTLPNMHCSFKSHTSPVEMESNPAMREFEYGTSPTSDSQPSIATIETTSSASVTPSMYQVTTKDGAIEE
jgi:hypothetical protein